MNPEEERNDTPYTQRKISVTKSHNDKMQKLADEYYGGNVSQLVRSAIEDHARTINGVNENLLRELLDDVIEIKELIDQLNTQINQQNTDSDPNSPKYTTDNNGDSQYTANENSILSDNMLSVYQYLANYYPNFRSRLNIISDISLLEDDVNRALFNLKARGDIDYKTIENIRHYKIISEQTMFMEK